MWGVFFKDLGLFKLVFAWIKKIYLEIFFYYEKNKLLLLLLKKFIIIKYDDDDGI